MQKRTEMDKLVNQNFMPTLSVVSEVVSLKLHYFNKTYDFKILHFSCWFIFFALFYYCLLKLKKLKNITYYFSVQEQAIRDAELLASHFRPE